ncbi:MAG: AsmA family protein [Kiritimatiellae bacterium]|nr:AsmA family protein [Verrucomicrobiota bacterium]MBU4285607.1 AsmA family protein [Verrucomicrobiota bacterium]MBU4367019.1 AsmA family protein [Verrucomicrobiota bacterium]MCG2660426.1 AsmA family protein [Kiritimatiellia bacterium]
MKKTLIVIVVLLMAAVIGLQLFLAYGLTDSMRQLVLPMAKDRWNLDVTLERVSVNLLGGSLSIHGVHVINPPGFDDQSMITMKRFKLTIGLLALFRGGIAEIEKATIRDASLSVVRNREGVLNIEPALEAIHTAMSNAPAAAPGAAGPATPGDATPHVRRIPDIAIRQIEVKTLLQYVDHKISEPPFRLGLDIQVRLKDITNYGRDDVMSGTINLLGHILTTDRKCAFDLNGRIAPIKDPSRLSFDLTGSIQTIDFNNFQDLAKRCGFEKGQISGTMTLYCEQGVFDPEKSVLHLTFNKVKLTKEQQEQFSGIPFPETFKALVPVKGTLTNPEIDIREALMKTLASKDTFDAIIKGVLEAQGRSADSQTKSNAPNADSSGKGKPDQPLDIKDTLGGLLGKPE